MAVRRLAGVDRVAMVAGQPLRQLDPERNGAFVIAAALGKHRQLTVGLRAKFGGKAEVEGFRAGSVCSIRIAAALQKPRETQEIDVMT